MRVRARPFCLPAPFLTAQQRSQQRWRYGFFQLTSGFCNCNKTISKNTSNTVDPSRPKCNRVSPHDPHLTRQIAPQTTVQPVRSCKNLIGPAAGHNVPEPARSPVIFRPQVRLRLHFLAAIPSSHWSTWATSFRDVRSRVQTIIRIFRQGFIVGIEKPETALVLRWRIDHARNMSRRPEHERLGPGQQGAIYAAVHGTM